MKNGFETSYLTDAQTITAEIIEKLSLCLSAAKSVEEIISVLRQRIKPIFGTNNLLLCQLNEDKITYSIVYLLSSSDIHGEFNSVYQELRCDYFDNYFDKVIEAKVPLLLETRNHVVGKQHGIAAIFTILRVEEIVGIPISDLEQEFALFFDTSPTDTAGRENLLTRCKLIMAYLRLAFAKIRQSTLLTRTLELQQQERLLHIKLATAYTKNDVRSWLLRYFLPHIGAEQASISIISKDDDHYYRFLDTQLPSDNQLSALTADCSKLSLHGSVIGRVFTGRSSQREVSIEKKGTETNTYHLPLFDDGNIIAVFSIRTYEDNHIDQKTIEPFESSIVNKLVFLKGQEEQLRIRKERAFVKELGLGLSSIHTKDDFLGILLSHLRKIWEFADLALLVPSTALAPDGLYLSHFEIKRREHPYFKEWTTDCLSRFIALEAPDEDHCIQVFDVEDLPVNALIKTAHITFCKETGIEQALTINLQNDGKFIGCLILLSEKRTFPALEPFFKFSLSFLLSLTTSSLIAKDLFAIKEQQGRSLINIGKSLASFHNSQDLLNFIFNRLTRVISFLNISIVLVRSLKKQFSLLVPDMYQYREQDASIFSGRNWKNIDGHQLLQLVSKKAPAYIKLEDLPDELLPFVANTSIDKVLAIIGCFPIPVDPEIAALLFTVFPATTDLAEMTERFNILVPYLTIALKNAKTYERLKQNLFQGVSSQIASAASKLIANARAAQQIREIEVHPHELEQDLSLQEEIKTNYAYSDIIGVSPLMQNVYRLVDRVSQSDSTVLISGETGTGKELLARAIHNHSARKNKLMVKINCAAMPANLIESELFGHEKGSFTGASERKIGKFELAHQGTLFLDEVGEMPLDLQVKLLRVLQEREFERVGGNTPIKIDVRIIAATHRNLQQEVTAGNFRADLFYRLNVFPIVAPALRDRKQDLSMLVQHFIQKYNRKIGREIAGISQEVMQSLLQYSWPGNIRELEHYIERSLLMTSGKIIKEINLPESAPPTSSNEIMAPGSYQNGYSLKEHEKQHLMSVLSQCNGKVAGPSGAAQLLGMPATTVYSKIKRLGLSKTYRL